MNVFLDLLKQIKVLVYSQKVKETSIKFRWFSFSGYLNLKQMFEKHFLNELGISRLFHFHSS